MTQQKDDLLEERALAGRLAGRDARLDGSGLVEQRVGRRVRRVERQRVLANACEVDGRERGRESVSLALAREEAARGEPCEQPGERAIERRHEAARRARLLDGARTRKRRDQVEVLEQMVGRQLHTPALHVCPSGHGPRVTPHTHVPDVHWFTRG